MTVSSFPSFETVIITYNKDFVKLQKCLQSIIEHGLGYDTELVHIVVNDHNQAMTEIVNFIPNDPRFKVWHYTQIYDWPGPLDWHSQQWFKLVASKIVLSDWYLLLDSDLELLSPIRHTDMFKYNKACGRQRPIDYENAVLVKQLSFAYTHWNNTMDNWKYFMTDQIPFLMHTDTVKNMVLDLDHNFFNVQANSPPGDVLPTNSPPTKEFLLWSAYLDHHGIKDKLYYPTSTDVRLFNTRLQTDNH